jgi:AcrR family transcriptional regulator
MHSALLSTHLYLKDPQSTLLGQKILSEALLMLHAQGFESFTFRKLALAIASTEASVYRYFENKHKLLAYLVEYYWAGMNLTTNKKFGLEQASDKRMCSLLRLLSGIEAPDCPGYRLDTTMLYALVVAESTKAYHTHHVDRDNAEGLFAAYKQFSRKMAALVKELAPHYPYPQALVSILLEAARLECFFSEHLPSLTEFNNANGRPAQLYKFLEGVTFSSIGLVPPSTNTRIAHP